MSSHSKRHWRRIALMAGSLLLAGPVYASETCQTAAEMNPATLTTLQNTAKRYFDMAARGDSAALRQNTIPGLAANFGGVEAAVNDNKANFAGAQSTVRPPYLLQETAGSAPQRAEFYCGIYNSSDRVGFAIPNLPPGNYGVVIQDVTTPKGQYSVTMVLQQEQQPQTPQAAAAGQAPASQWMLAGYYVRPETVNGHNAQWFWDQARQFKQKGQMLNAYFYYVQARQLMSPVDFMGTPQLDKLYDETQQAVPKDIPVSGPVDQSLGGKTFKLSEVFPVLVGSDLDLVVKYQVPDISNTTQVFQDNMTVIKGMVAKYPELRDTFAAVVARAVAPNGQDYGSLLPMKEIK